MSTCPSSGTIPVEHHKQGAVSDGIPSMMSLDNYPGGLT
jgi:hypothetical protein